MSVLRVFGGPPRVKIAAKAAQVALTILYEYFCGPAAKQIESPQLIFNDFNEESYGVDRVRAAEAILDRIKANLGEEV